MENCKNSYETLYIINAALAEDAIKALVEKFTALIAQHGEVTEVNEWGKRRLAYPINDRNEGYYVQCTFESESDFPNELERIFGITDGIERSIVVRVEKKASEKTEKYTMAIIALYAAFYGKSTDGRTKFNRSTLSNLKFYAHARALS